jgi:hypothetical protein
MIKNEINMQKVIPRPVGVAVTGAVNIGRLRQYITGKKIIGTASLVVSIIILMA